MKRFLSVLFAVLMLLVCVGGIAMDEEEVCGHKNVKAVLNHQVYEQLNVSQHVVIKYYDKVCAACGEIVGSYNSGRKGEAHDFDEDGVCVCGYVYVAHVPTAEEIAACEHSNLKTVLNHQEYERLNASQHIVVKYYDRVCAFCGKVMGGYSSGQNGEAHAFDENGICVCGYSNVRVLTAEEIAACDHKNVKAVLNHQDYKQRNGTQHFVTKYYDKVCTNCGTVVGNYSSGQTGEAHTFDENGVCVCGYSNVRVLTAEEIAACEHKNVMAVLNHEEYETQNNKQHLVNKYYDKVCAYCGTVVGSYSSGQTGEAHTFDENGVCACGYSNVRVLTAEEIAACEHKNVMAVLNHQNYEQRNDTQHFVTKYYDKVCTNCGTVVGSYSSGKNGEAHTFDENGVCACGFVYCAHAQTEKVYTNEIGYTDVTEKGHNVANYYAVVCTTCGKKIAERSEKEFAAHEFVDGVCACGYACPHEKKSRIFLDDGVYEVVSLEGHHVQYHTCDVCQACGKKLSDETVTTLYEAHELEDGVCACGFEMHSDSALMAAIIVPVKENGTDGQYQIIVLAKENVKRVYTENNDGYGMENFQRTDNDDGTVIFTRIYTAGKYDQIGRYWTIFGYNTSGTFVDKIKTNKINIYVADKSKAVSFIPDAQVPEAEEPVIAPVEEADDPTQGGIIIEEIEVPEFLGNG